MGFSRYATVQSEGRETAAGVDGVYLSEQEERENPLLYTISPELALKEAT